MGRPGADVRALAHLLDDDVPARVRLRALLGDQVLVKLRPAIPPPLKRLAEWLGIDW